MSDGEKNTEGREKLQAYLTQTIVRLQMQSYCMSPTKLKNEVMPAIVKSIRQMCGGAPPAVQEEFKGLLTAYRVLPNYDADIAALEEALRKIHLSVHKSLKHAPQRAAMELRLEHAIAVNADGGAAADAASYAGHYDQKLLHDYAKKQWSKLSDPAVSGKAAGKAASEKDRDVEFSAAVLPMILSKLQQLSCYAPVELRVALARILVWYGVWPDGSVEIDGSQALPKLMKIRACGALQQICALMHKLTQGDSSDAYCEGLTSPIHIEVVAASGDRIADVPLASGASVSTLRGILAAFENFPADNVSLVREGTQLDDKELLIEQCQVLMVRGDGPSMAGVYAGYSCDILVLYPNGQAAAHWYDDYWQTSNCPIRNVPDVKRIAGKWARGDVDAKREQHDEEEVAKLKQGSWTVITDGSQRFVKGTVYEPYLDNLYTFTFEVQYDRCESCEGNSPVTLYGLANNHFSYSQDGLDSGCKHNGPESKSFYFISELAATA
eukprot:TRINITY_DN22105_c0_g1_i1.p1 TRINITY_DN22105_c0_g1~~TRINITY_DN22105_c0_g1_i1.p1  ORF type:complete len:495 (+),score=55.72 TRINITY_DN22105_c0_g1_i1:124-1608(+)